MYFCYFVIISPWKRVLPFILTNLNPLHPRMHIVPSLVEIGSLVLETKWKNVKSLRWQQQRWQTMDKFRRAKAHLSPLFRWPKKKDIRKQNYLYMYKYKTSDTSCLENVHKFCYITDTLYLLMLTVNGKFKGHKFVTSPMRIHENMHQNTKNILLPCT